MPLFQAGPRHDTTKHEKSFVWHEREVVSYVQAAFS